MTRLVSMAVAACVLTAAPVLATAQSLAGPYRVEGKGFDGKPYSGTAQITFTSNDTCRIVWKIGGEESKGICMRSRNAFVASYVLQGAAGLVIYEVNADGTLDGRWTVADENGVGTERLTPRR